MEVVMKKYERKLHAEQVLELLRSGKTAKQIADEYQMDKNAVDAHIRRLRAKGLLEKSDRHTEGQVIHMDSSNADQLLDAFLRRIEKNLELEKENAQLKDENWRLKNQLAAVQNELEIEKERGKTRVDIQNRMRNIAQGIESSQVKLTQEAIN